MVSSTVLFTSGSKLSETSFALVRDRIQDKLADYAKYSFSSHQTKAFNVFFDLAQEFDSVADVLTVAVQIIHTFFDMHAEVYVLDEQSRLSHRFCSFGRACPWVPLDPDTVEITKGPFVCNSLLCFPIRGKQLDRELLPILPQEDVLGVLAVHTTDTLSKKDRLCLEKFANRVGYQLHNKLLAMKHREHLAFVKGLVHDIGHNVIAPNMYFKLLFKQLDSKMQAMREALSDSSAGPECNGTIRQLEYIQDRMEEQYKDVYRYFQQTSLFLETLLRQSHFESGHYVLQKNTVDLLSRVLTPQFERFQGRFLEKGIAVFPPKLSRADADLSVVIDVGLMSQVVANLFSNAVKYTREGVAVEGVPTKHVRCSISRRTDYFASGEDGVRVDVFTTGPSIHESDAVYLFDPNFRGNNVGREYGTGHGLFFVREIVELHNGVAGHELWPGGNCFYLILPCSSTPFS